MADVLIRARGLRRDDGNGARAQRGVPTGAAKAEVTPDTVS